MSTQINASFSNNRNNGLGTAKAPSTVFDSGYFVVYNGLGGVMPYAASSTLFGAQTGTFVLGETVTQATSSATGVIVAITAAGIVVKTVTGTFDTTHVVTGGTSSATMTPTAVVANSKILGLSNSVVSASSSNFTNTSDVSVSTPVNIMDELDIPVSIGTPTTAMVGQYCSVDPLNPGAVDVTSLSAVSGQILITRVTNSAAAPAGFIKGIIASTVA